MYKLAAIIFLISSTTYAKCDKAQAMTALKWTCSKKSLGKAEIVALRKYRYCKKEVTWLQSPFEMLFHPIKRRWANTPLHKIKNRQDRSIYQEYSQKLFDSKKDTFETQLHFKVKNEISSKQVMGLKCEKKVYAFTMYDLN
jgi:hypothetical protein